jgi:tol-pal system protein YbgF
MKNFYICLLIGLLPFYNFASGAEALDQRLDSLEKRLQNIQKSLANINSQQDNNEYKELFNEVKTLRSEVERLDSRVTENSIAIKDFEKNEDANKNNNSINAKDEYIINNIAREIVNEKNQDIKQDLDKSNDKLVATQYQAAYLLFKQKDERGKTNYDLAQDAFSTFVTKYPNHPLTGNAFYWLGQIQFELGNYNKAAIFYLKGHKVNSSSGRALDNLLGLSRSLAKLGKDKETCASLNQIFNDFSTMNSDIKQEVEELYKNNNCASD